MLFYYIIKNNHYYYYYLLFCCVSVERTTVVVVNFGRHRTETDRELHGVPDRNLTGQLISCIRKLLQKASVSRMQK